MLSRTGKLNKRFVFKEKGNAKTGINGQKEFEWPEKSTVWGNVQQKMISQIENEVGGELEDSVTVVIRQNQPIEPQLDWRIEIGGRDYEILKINPDVKPRGFMVLIVKAVA